MIGAPVLAAALAALALFAAGALVLARTRVGAATALGAAGLPAGLAAAAMGAGSAGIALALAAAFIAMLALAAGASAGEAAPDGRSPRTALAASLLAGLALLATTPWAPPAREPSHVVAPALALARGGDLFIALAALVGVAGAAAAVLGFGERGVLGARAERSE